MQEWPRPGAGGLAGPRLLVGASSSRRRAARSQAPHREPIAPVGTSAEALEPATSRYGRTHGISRQGWGNPLIRAVTSHHEAASLSRVGRTTRRTPRSCAWCWTRRVSQLVWTVALSTLVAGEAAAAEGGLQLLPDLQLLGTLLVLFGLLIVPVNQVIFKPIFRALDDRADKISGTRARAERLERDAEAVLGRYQTTVREVREEAESARRARLEEARGETARTTAEARAAAESEIERARAELSAALEEARASLRGQSQELAREAAARVLGRAL